MRRVIQGLFTYFQRPQPSMGTGDYVLARAFAPPKSTLWVNDPSNMVQRSFDVLQGGDFVPTPSVANVSAAGGGNIFVGAQEFTGLSPIGALDQ